MKYNVSKGALPAAAFLLAWTAMHAPLLAADQTMPPVPPLPANQNSPTPAVPTPPPVPLPPAATPTAAAPIAPAGLALPANQNSPPPTVTAIPAGKAKPGPIMSVSTDETGAIEGAIVAVPVPKLLNDTYINLGSAHNVKAGDYFLAYNANIKTIAILKVTAVQDRVSVVKPVAQLASLRKGDRVKAINAERAASL